MIELGSKVKDTVTGLVGIATARTEWLNGCARVTIQPQELKDGRPVEGYTVDEPQIEVLEVAAVKRGPTDTGGPIPEPSRNPDPQR